MQTRTKSINVITTRSLIDLLVEEVATAETQDLLKQCLQIGMVEHHLLERDMALSMPTPGFPAFEVRYHFIFKLDGEYEAVFEILGKEGFILQAGYQAMFPRRLLVPPRGSGKYRAAIESLENHYGTGVPMALPGIQMMQYTNATTLGYASLMKMGGSQSLAVRVGNRCFWE